MKAIFFVLFVLLGAMACLAKSPDKYVETDRDSLTDFTNVMLVTADSLSNEDSVYCDRVVLAGESEVNAKDERKASFYTCGDKRVSQFTFAGYEGAYAKFLYKPEGTDQVYFGKARIRTDGIRKAYTIKGEDVRKRKDKDSSGRGSRGASLFTLLAMIALTATLIYVLGR